LLLGPAVIGLADQRLRQPAADGVLAPALRDRSISRLIRATTVVSQARRSSIAPVSLRPSRSQASCTASWASLSEPSMP